MSLFGLGECFKGIQQAVSRSLMMRRIAPREIKSLVRPGR